MVSKITGTSGDSFKSRSRSLARLGILPTEALHAPSRIHQPLFTGKERMANRANFHVNVALVGRTSLKIVSAGAHHPHRVVIGMNLFLGHLEDRPFLQFSLL